MSAPVSAPSATTVPDAAGIADTRVRATVYVLVAFDVGNAIDLDLAERRLAAGAHREGLGPSRRTPPYLDYRPLPVRVTGQAAPVDVRGARPNHSSWRTEPAFDAVIFDFGAISVTYRIAFEGTLGQLLDLSAALYEHRPIMDGARAVLTTLESAIREAISRPLIAEPLECYVVFQFDDPKITQMVRARRPDTDALLAGILRSERLRLSSEEITDAMTSRISYGERDVALIDWNSAIIVEPGDVLGTGAVESPPSGADDEVRFVLEYANVELLEMRVLDDRLDQILDESYRLVAGHKRRRLFRLTIGTRELNRIARLQMDSALLYEGVNNAIKLVGDQYLARVYRLAAERFHLPERDSGIERKLSTLESIYTKLQDAQGRIRMEVLEWIIIVLFLVSIVLPFIPWGHAK